MMQKHPKVIMKPKVCIIGAGGSARSIFQVIRMMNRHDEIVAFLETDEYYVAREIHGVPVKPLSFFSPLEHQALISFGDSNARAKMVSLLPENTDYATYIYSDVMIIAPEETSIGKGSVIYPGCKISGDVDIGEHSLILANAVLGHDVTIGDFFTSGVGLTLGGHCQIGQHVQCGMSVSIRDRATICDHAVLGMGAVIMRDIKEPGVYIGNPARKAK